jgi:predicted dehydrogenase
MAAVSEDGKCVELAREFNIPDACDDYRRILERRDIDVVDLCIPTDLHEKFSIDAERLENISFAKSR